MNIKDRYFPMFDLSCHVVKEVLIVSAYAGVHRSMEIRRSHR